MKHFKSAPHRRVPAPAAGYGSVTGLFKEQKAKVKVKFWHRHVDSAEQERLVAPESLRVLDPSLLRPLAHLPLPAQPHWAMGNKQEVSSVFLVYFIKS